MIYVVYGLIALVIIAFFSFEVWGLVKDIKAKKRKREELKNKSRENPSKSTEN